MVNSPYCIISALYSAYKGKMNTGYAFCGSNAFRATKIERVKDVISDLKEGYKNLKNQKILRKTALAY
jgi:hypothetical protein